MLGLQARNKLYAYEYSQIWVQSVWVQYKDFNHTNSYIFTNDNF